MTDHSVINLPKLLEVLLPMEWHRDCRIIEATDLPEVYVYHPPTGQYLRYSAGPLQCYFWDIYGDDMLNPELAIYALSRAPRPPGAIGCNEPSETIDPKDLFMENK